MKERNKIVVLGAGLVGKAIAVDLNKNFEVTSVDIDQQALENLNSKYSIPTINADLSDKKIIQSVVENFDLVVGALPGFMGYEGVKNVIETGKDIVDISFFQEDPFGLNDLAINRNVTAITDCGIAPGMSNIILGYHNERMKVEKFKCMVGGLPVIREWPFEYKAVFSPIDVIEEYVRPARYVEKGKLVTREALSDPELVYFKDIGKLEAWNSDGLRTLVDTMNIPNMIEKTLRYPGTIEYLRVLRECGFFSYEELNVKGKKVRPIDVTSELLFPKWELKPGEEDFTVMRITIEGKENNEEKFCTYDLHDKYDRESSFTSMARTTGYTCTAVANLVLNGKFNRKGICPPEFLVNDEENFSYILDYLNERGVIFRVK